MRPFLLASFLTFGCLNLVVPVSARKKATTVASGGSQTSQGKIEGTFTSTKLMGETVLITTDENGLKLHLVTEGTVTVAEDERSITDLSAGGRFEYSRKEKNGPEHKVELRNKSGKLEGKYFIDGQAQDYATAGKAWLAQYLPEMVTKTGLGAEARAERLYREGGIQKVLGYTATMEAGSGKTKMYRFLLAKPDLKAQDAQLLLEQIAKGNTSDYETASILTKLPTSLLANAETAQAYVAANARISSDYEKARSLKHLLQQQNLSDKALDNAAQVMGSLGSNYEKVKVLTVLANRPKLSEKQFELGMQALKTVSSDYERTKGLGAFMRHEQQVITYFDKVLPLISGISSDYEKAKAYSSLLGNSRLGTNQYVPFLKASQGISSDYEKAKLLRKVAAQLPKDDQKVKEAYAQAARTVSSDYEYKKVIAAYQ